MKRRKLIVLITAAFLVLVLIGLSFYSHFYLARSFSFDPKGVVFLGDPKAKVELVLFEDFQCSHCQNFMEKVFPQIKNRYVDEGMVHFVIVPLPFFPGSKILINAALTIFHEDPKQFFLFLRASAKEFPKNKVTGKAILSVARKVGGIDLERLEQCIKDRCYYSDIDKNFKKARSIMKNNVLVPTLYVNRVATSTVSFDSVEKMIEETISKAPKK